MQPRPERDGFDAASRTRLRRLARLERWPRDLSLAGRNAGGSGLRNERRGHFFETGNQAPQNERTDYETSFRMVGRRVAARRRARLQHQQERQQLKLE